jgi:hypothetical protein
MAVPQALLEGRDAAAEQAQERRRKIRAELEAIWHNLQGEEFPMQVETFSAASFQEAQVSPRYPLALRVSVQASGGPVLRGRTLNLSNSGVGVVLPRRLPPGTPVCASLYPRWGNVPLVGTVVWSDEASAPGMLRYRHGIKFRRDQSGTFALDIHTAELLGTQRTLQPW